MNVLKASVVSALLFSASLAQAAVLDFSGNICGDGTQACGNYSAISQNYGDIAGQVDVVYDGHVSVPGSSNLSWWDNYTGQLGVAWGSNGGTSEIFLSPSAGYQITLNSITFGSYAGVNRSSQYTLLDGNSNVLSPSNTFSLINPLTFALNVTSGSGIKIQWGPDAFDVGIDNINFTVSQINVNAVPLPAAVWLFGSALLSFVGFSNRRKV